MQQYCNVDENTRFKILKKVWFHLVQTAEGEVMPNFSPNAELKYPSFTNRRGITTELYQLISIGVRIRKLLKGFESIGRMKK